MIRGNGVSPFGFTRGDRGTEEMGEKHLNDARSTIAVQHYTKFPRFYAGFPVP